MAAQCLASGTSVLGISRKANSSALAEQAAATGARAPNSALRGVPTFGNHPPRRIHPVLVAAERRAYSLVMQSS